ncbi:MAG: choice-of-anchor O protein [Pelovirga sp.]
MRYLILLLSLLLAVPALADDGAMFRKNVSATPDLETEFAAIRMLPLYVPAQNTSGELVTISYPLADGTDNTEADRTFARPLIGHYTDGHVEGIDEEGYGGFPGHGERDAYGAVSLDDGNTWKRSNLSKSADLSSFKIKNGRKKVAYPGDVGRTFAASDGNKVLIAWVSRYCGGGNPTYAITDTELSALEAHFTADERIDPVLYLDRDLFGVPGSQRSSDLADEGYPLIGELPFACVWTARGVIHPPVEENGTSNFTWFKAERLTSGVRDANRPEAVCVKGAGCAVTWQEDPDGIRPGEGEGPGEGWSGAIAHHQTDTWYAYISWDDFDLVADGSYGTVDADFDWTSEGTPMAAIPFAMPVRLSDNAMCVMADADGNADDAYCYHDFDASGVADFCASSIQVTIDTPEGPTQDVNMCITEDGRLLRGNTAATRARISLHGYSAECAFDKLNPDSCPITSAWFSMAYEENKGLGEDGEEEVVSEDLIEKVDMGKNVWYHTFDMFNPEVVSQGLMLNQPAIYPDDFTNPEGFLTQYTELGYNFYQIDPDPVYETQAGINTTLLQSEIARRPSPISQDWYDAGTSGTVAFQLWKQGIIRRGGPADIMGRRFVMPLLDETCTTETVCDEICTIEHICTTEKVCTIESVCSDNLPNPDYNYHPGQCRRDPTQLRCYPYLDTDGNPTLAAQTCVNTEVCADVETCQDVETCVIDDSTCGDEEVCTGGVDYTANPYDYANMVCENADGSPAWAFTDGSNPRYVKGLCAAPAINLSGNTIIEGECGDAATCLDVFPINEYFDDFAGGTQVPKIWEWQQYGPGYGEEPLDDSNLNDASWDNPYDVAKGHRGFMAGDMIMAMYAWSPNWMANSVGHDNYNLYARRSFDGGKTWSTLPASFTHSDGITYSGDGTTTCEWMGPAGSATEYPVCVAYSAGAFEQARNLSQLVGTQTTILDPRYSPTTRSITLEWVSTLSLPPGFTAPDYADDNRNPSRFFMVYETGDNTTVASGEAEPLDLFYSRAVNWGDNYLVWADETDLSSCLPAADTTELAGFCNEFDALEGSILAESGEASITSSPGGQFFYSIWNQWDFDRQDGEEIGADAWFRRVLFVDEETAQ